MKWGGGESFEPVTPGIFQDLQFGRQFKKKE